MKEATNKTTTANKTVQVVVVVLVTPSFITAQFYGYFFEFMTDRSNVWYYIYNSNNTNDDDEKKRIICEKFKGKAGLQLARLKTICVQFQFVVFKTNHSKTVCTL